MIKYSTLSAKKLPFYNKRFKDMDDSWLILEYRCALNDKDRLEALDELLTRHYQMFYKLVLKVYPRIKSNMELDDLMQNVTIFAIHVYDTYDLDKTNKSKVSSYVYNSIKSFMLTDINNSDMIRYPRHIHTIKNYVNGIYDNRQNRKSQIEEKLNLKTEDEKYNFLQKNSNLKLNISSYDCENVTSKDKSVSIKNIIPDEKNTEKQIMLSVMLKQAVNGLQDFHKQVFSLYFEENQSVNDIASRLRKKPTAVYGSITHIKKYFTKKHGYLLECI